MPRLKNISPDTYKLMGKHVWHPGDVLEVPEAVAKHVLEAQAGRFELVPDDTDVDKAPNRQQKSGFKRSR